MTIVAWNTEGSKMSLPIEDNYEEDEEDGEEKYADTFEKTSKNIRNAGLGYESVSDDLSSERMKKVIILGLEVPATKNITNCGRMSVIYYQELEGNDYIEKLNKWYSKCKWLLYKNQEKGWIEGTPTPKQISQAVIGIENVKIAEEDSKFETFATKQMRQLRMRLLRCIVDGTPISKDIIQSAFLRATSPQHFKKSNGSWSRFMWKSNMAVACALISKLFDQQGVVVTHELDTKCTRRDYLYGRLLAVADIIECSSMGLPKDYQSSAVRYMQRFVQQPAETWKKIYLRLIPYLGRLKGYASYYQYLIGQIESLFDKEDRLSRKSLSYDFLCGYFSQQQKLMEKKDKTDQSDMYKDSDTEEVEPLKEYQFPIDRDGLYGCLLAVADVVEYRALGEDYRGSTNALRLMESFSLRPVETWENIHSRMLPYLEKKPDSFYQYCFSQIESRFMEEERENNTGLNKNFIYEYSRMRWALLHKNMPKLDMGIAEKNVVMTRDIAYGRLLKIENLIESKVLGKIEDENKRQTNAIRWMAEFSKKPSSVWKNVLRQKLKPYERKEKWLMANKYSKQLEILETCIYRNGWDTDEPLSGMYLYGFYANFNDDFCDIEGR
jgi:CRISPR-associated protein Csd1